MVNVIFGIICILSCTCAVITGNTENMSMAVIEGTKDAVSLVIVLVGVICLWNGIMNVFNFCGIITYLTKLLMPVLKFLYPDAYKRNNGLNEIAMSMTANFFGLGNAATALSLSAMSKLKENSKEESASFDMITFTVLSTCAINFIPTTLIALRYASGSTDPFEVVFPIWICSFSCFVFAILVLKSFRILFRRW